MTSTSYGLIKPVKQLSLFNNDLTTPDEEVTTPEKQLQTHPAALY